MNKNISEICLDIDDIIKKQDIPYPVYKEILNLLCDIMELAREKEVH